MQGKNINAMWQTSLNTTCLHLKYKVTYSPADWCKILGELWDLW